MVKENRSQKAKETDTQLEQAIRQAMSTKGLTHAALAQRLGVKSPSVTKLIIGKTGIIPQSLIGLLEALDLELTAVPRTGEHG